MPRKRPWKEIAEIENAKKRDEMKAYPKLLDYLNFLGNRTLGIEYPTSFFDNPDTYWWEETIGKETYLFAEVENCWNSSLVLSLTKALLEFRGTNALVSISYPEEGKYFDLLMELSNNYIVADRYHNDFLSQRLRKASAVTEDGRTHYENMEGKVLKIQPYIILSIKLKD